MLMLAASIALGAAAVMSRRQDTRLYSLAAVMSVLSIAASAVDESLDPSSAAFLIAMVAPFAVMIFSLGSMLLGGKSRWLRRGRPRTCCQTRTASTRRRRIRR